MRTIGVMGASALPQEPEQRARVLRLAELTGTAIAEADCALITGATTGIPHAVALAAQAAGGISIGISPAENNTEHTKEYGLPTDAFDAIIYTGFGLRGRNVVNVRSSDLIIVLGGGVGTLNEITIAWAERKLIGVVDVEPGLTTQIRCLIETTNAPPMRVVTNSDPRALVEQCLKECRNNAQPRSGPP